MLEQRATMPFRSQRFEIIRRLGSGGMGVVYEARDRINGNLVAIKVLSDLDPESLLRFKTEFRALQNVHHPNLVQLYELIEEEGTWFFTMELVHGVAFDEYTRPGGEEIEHEGSTSRQGEDMPTRVDGRSGEASRSNALRSEPSSQKQASQEAAIPAIAMPEVPSAEISRAEVSSSDDSTARDTMTELRDGTGESGSRPPRRVSIAPRPGAVLDEARLRRALAQLAAGLYALHQANKVHCDVKPSNVLVNDERAVLIDFGILLDVGRGGSSRSKIIGTPAFMAPEQAAMKTVGPAADWYAVGGILYLALTGRVPFAGRVDDVLEMKQRCEPVPPDSLVQGLPHDLVRLCVELLSLDPNARPKGADIVERLRSTYISETRLPAAPREHFLGRQKELARLGDAFESCDKEGVAVVLHGEAGIGKSSLAARFTASLDAEGRAWVLTGRCDQRETVPFKALDEVFDALGSEIAARYSRGATALLPERADLLAQTFPTLQRIAAFQQAPKLEAPVDERRTRDLVFAAARDFVAKLAKSERLCILIEDLHWADPDSLALIIELMRPPSPAGVMLLATTRTSEGIEHVRDLKEALGERVRVVEVTSLPPEDALSLAEHFVGTSAARAIIEETGGHPLFIDALARSGVSPGDAGKGRTTLDEALWDRAEATSPAAREVLALLALTPVALSQSLIATATGMTLEQSVYATAELRAQRLIRMDEGGAQPYHDLVRRAVVAHVPPEANAARHAALASALEGHLSDRPETLAIHWMEAGQRARALGPALIAAEQATRALAFDRAARLHALVLELLPPGDSRRRDLHLAHGKALTNAGRGAEAARAYLAAAALATEGVVELRRVAAELYLTSGHIDEGLAILETVLEPMGIKISSTQLGALGSLLVRRAQIRIGGIDLSRLREVIPQDDATRIDACWSAAAGLGLVNTIQGAEFQARHFQLALRDGDRYRAARAIATEACYVSTGGVRASGRAARLLDLAAELAHQVGDPRAIGLVAGARGVAAAQLGRWREGRDANENGESILRERCQGVAWELNTARLFRLVCMVYLGEMASVVANLPAALRESEERGDLNGMIGLQTGRTNAAWLVRDDPDEAERQLDDGLRRWSRRGYQLPHYQAWAARVDVYLYRGHFREAFDLVVRERPLLRRSLFLRVHLIRAIVDYAEARAALAAARASRGTERTQFLNLAANATKKLQKERAHWTSALALLLDAQALVAAGRREQALDRFREARQALAAADMHLDAAVARRSYGLLLGGAAGAVEIREAEAWMARERIAKIDAMCSVLAPFGTAD